MADRSHITPDLCRQLLRYEPATGRLFWLPRDRDGFKNLRLWASWNGAYAGKEAFKGKDGRGYHCGGVAGRSVFAHRVAWAIVHGEWPDQIDHINGDRADNRIANLRNVDARENLKNKSIYKTNKSDVVGVLQERNGRWRAKILDIRLGTYLTKAEAVAARKAAEKCLGFHANNGRPK